MLRYVIPLVLGLTAPAVAQEIVQDEPLVMRLIFDDCLGYVTKNAEPFGGLTAYALSPEVEKSLPEAAFKAKNRVQII